MVKTQCLQNPQNLISCQRQQESSELRTADILMAISILVSLFVGSLSLLAYRARERRTRDMEELRKLGFLLRKLDLLAESFARQNPPTADNQQAHPK